MQSPSSPSKRGSDFNGRGKAKGADRVINRIGHSSAIGHRGKGGWSRSAASPKERNAKLVPTSSSRAIDDDVRKWVSTEQNASPLSGADPSGSSSSKRRAIPFPPFRQLSLSSFPNLAPSN